MRAAFVANLTRQTLATSLTGAEVTTLPPLLAGKDHVFSFAFAEERNGSPVITPRVVTAWKCSLGLVDEQPTEGTWKLKIGSASAGSGNTTAAMNWNIAAVDLQTAINALADLPSGQHPVTVTPRDNSWIVKTADGSAITLSERENALYPMSRLVVRSTTMADGSVEQELRLVQYPLAFTDSQARVLPPVPAVSRLREGLTNDGIAVNEVQKLDFTQGFVGSYIIKLGTRESVILQVQDAQGNAVDGAPEIEAALNTLGAPDGGTFKVTNPENNVAHVEFTGSYAGNTFDLLVIEAVSAPEGDVTCTLSLRNGRLYRWLQAQDRTQPAMARLEIVAYLQSVSDEEVIERHVLANFDVEIQGTITDEDLATVPNINWLLPFRESYTPGSTDALGTGSQHNHETFGDGSAVVFHWEHLLDSDDLIFTLRENFTGGRELINGTDYTVIFDDSNNLSFTMLAGYAATPATTGQLRASVVTADQRVAIVPHTHPISDIVGLQTLLNTISANVTDLQGRIGVGTFANPTTGSADKIVAMSWTLNQYAEIFGRRSRTKLSLTSLVDYDATTLPRHGGALLSAIHASSSTTFPTSLTGGVAGTLYKNESGSTISVPGGKAHKGFDLADGEYAAWSGDIWYKVAKEVSSEKTYYPVDFLRELLFIPVQAAQFRVGYELSLRFGLELATINADVRFHYMLVIEQGAIGSDASPSTTGANLSNITWNATPMLAQPLIVGPESTIAVFGVRIQNKTGGLVAKQLAYGGESAAGSTPAAATFALRARLIRPDTENGKPAALGFIGLRGLNAQPASTSGNADDTIGKCVITQI